MATVPNNQLINVATYQEAELAWMLDKFVAINISNKKFKDFQNKQANLGDTITFELAPQASITAGLVVNAFGIAQQRLQNLVCCQSSLGSAAFTEQQFLFNVQDYMKTFGRSRINALASVIEQNVLSNITGTQTVITPDSPNYGQLVDTTSGPYRFFGDGRTPINSQQQLAQSVANFEDYGAANYDRCAILPVTAIPPIAGTMLNQFVPKRNDELSMDWELGSFSGFDWYESNLLPIHFAGTVGKTNTTLTLLTTNDPTGAYITSLTFSGATANDSNAVVVGDLFEFNDGVGSLPNMRYLHFNGVGVSNQAVQCRVTSVSGADSSGHVTVGIYPALRSQPGLGQTMQNLNHSLQAGMQVSFVNDHRAGVLMSGNALYLAMPQLPDMQPYPTVTTTDPDSGASIRHYWGSGLGNNVRGYIWDQIWGSCLIAENSMRYCFPLTN